MPIREDIKEQVQQATDLVRLIGEQVALRPKGREFAGLCPFHDDKNPSMQVSPAKQIYKCFSCGAGGDAFSFVMNYHKMTFPEALRHLAERAGIEVREERGARGEGDGRTSERKQIAAANQQALEFFRAMLKHDEHGQVARDYIERRGISPEMVAAFQLGCAPDRWDGLALTIDRKGWPRPAFEAAGLVSQRREGRGFYDRMRHRLIFPICDALGRPIAFGGRKLREEDEPKYLNSPETKLFNKSRTLYGLHLAKKPIIDSHTAVIVEGYTDVIACHQAGVRNVVATLGTALTAEHIGELRKYAEKVVLIFDADAAGEKAADRAVELFLTAEVDVAIAELPHGPDGGKMDPAELMALEDGPQRWQKAMDEALDALAYQFGRIARHLERESTITGRQKVAEKYLSDVAQLGLGRAGAIRRSLVIQRLAGLLHMSEAAIDEILRKQVRKAPRVQGPGVRAPREQGVASGQANSGVEGLAEGEASPMLDPSLDDLAAASDGSEALPDENNVPMDVAAAHSGSRLRAVVVAERQLIGCLVKDNRLFTSPLPDGRSVDEAVPPQMITDAANRRLYQRVYDRLMEQESVTLTGLLADLASEGDMDLTSLLTAADQDAERLGPQDTVESLMRLAVQRLLAYHDQQAYRRQRQALAQEEDEQAVATRASRLLEPLRNASPVRIARFRG